MSTIDENRLNSARDLLGNAGCKDAVLQALKSVETDLAAVGARRLAPNPEMLHKSRGAALVLGLQGLADALADAEARVKGGETVVVMDLIEHVKSTRRSITQLF